MPQLVTTGRKAYMHATDDGVDGADARQILGVSTDRLVRARGCKLIRAAAASGDTNVHAVFSRTQLEHIRSALDDRTPAGRLAERLGISRHGVEQLVCLKEVDQADETFVRELYAGLQLSTRSVDRLMNDLKDKSDPSIAADPESVPLRRALMLIGGREKPWGPILKALRDGSISYGLEKGLTLAARVRIRLADVDSIVAMRFDRAAHRFDFSTRVNRRDSQETLNLTPVLMMSALRGELKVPGSEERDLALNHVLRVARRRISGGEILARWGNGRRMPRQFKNTRRLFRLDATGWDRSEVEAAMLSVSLPKGKNSNA